MSNSKPKYSFRNQRLPLLVEKGEDGFYVAECLFFEGCYSQGKTIDHALFNIKEVIQLISFSNTFQKSILKFKI